MTAPLVLVTMKRSVKLLVVMPGLLDCTHVRFTTASPAVATRLVGADGGKAAPRVHLVTSDQFYYGVLAYENIRKHGYERIGQVTTAAVGKKLRFVVGYQFAQSQDPASLRLPPLLFPGWPIEESQPKLVAWLKKTKPDAILTDQAPLRGMLSRAGYRVPEDVGLAATSVVDGYADAGIYQNSDEIGRAAVQMLISLIHHNQRGSPRVCRRVLVEGEWVDGKSLPSRDP